MEENEKNLWVLKVNNTDTQPKAMVFVSVSIVGFKQVFGHSEGAEQQITNKATVS